MIHRQSCQKRQLDSATTVVDVIFECITKILGVPQNDHARIYYGHSNFAMFIAVGTVFIPYFFLWVIGGIFSLIAVIFLGSYVAECFENAKIKFAKNIITKRLQGVIFDEIDELSRRAAARKDTQSFIERYFEALAALPTVKMDELCFIADELGDSISIRDYSMTGDVVTKITDGKVSYLSTVKERRWVADINDILTAPDYAQTESEQLLEILDGAIIPADQFNKIKALIYFNWKVAGVTMNCNSKEITFNLSRRNENIALVIPLISEGEGRWRNTL